MWQFDYLWVFLLLPLPWVVYRFMRPYHEARSALRVPFFFAMSRAVNQLPGISPPSGGMSRAVNQLPGISPPSGGRWQVLVNLLVWGLLVAACARPVHFAALEGREIARQAEEAMAMGA